MRKPFLLFAVFFLQWASANAQHPVQRVAKSYFRSDPFATEFGTFVNHLLNDPKVTEKEITRRTDSGFFYFQGKVNGFNPFFSKPDKIEVVLSEFVATLIDSLPQDTIFSYQLVAYYSDKNTTQKEIKKEFERIHKHSKAGFTESKFIDNPDGDGGELYNYFVPYHLLAPFSLSWHHHKESGQYYIAITLRLKPVANVSRLPYYIFH